MNIHDIGDRAVRLSIEGDLKAVGHTRIYPIIIRDWRFRILNTGMFLKFGNRNSLIALCTHTLADINTTVPAVLIDIYADCMISLQLGPLRFGLTVIGFMQPYIVW